MLNVADAWLRGVASHYIVLKEMMRLYGIKWWTILRELWISGAFFTVHVILI
jgi:hypothetical protein